MRNRWNSIGIVMILAAAIGIISTGCGSEAAAKEVTQTEETEETTEISVFGKVEAIDEEEIYIDFPAYVKDILVEEGEEVKAGDQLIALDYEEYKNTIETARVQKQLNMVGTQDSLQEVSAINSQISALEKEKALKQSYLQESNYQIQTLQNSLQVLDDKLAKAKEDYAALQSLLEAGAGTEEAVKEQKLSMNALENEKKNLEKQLQSFKEATQLEIDQLAATIAGKKDEMTQKKETNTRANSKEALSAQISDLSIENMNAKLNKPYIKDNYIVSAINHGIVEEIACEKGSFVGNNGPSYCMKLLDKDSIQVVADVPEEFINQIALNDSCKVIPYYDNTMSLDGKVVRINSRAVKEDGEVIVKVYIELTDKSFQIMPGLSVDVLF